MNTPVGTLLSRKGSALHSVAPSVTVTDAVRTMNLHKIGCLLVMIEQRLVGIFTERDILTRIVAAGLDPKVVSVQEVMTRNVVTITPAVTVERVMEIFFARRCRHLPVIDDGALVGLISIGDVSRWLVDVHRAEADSLRQYIAGSPAT